ncbi:guanylate kinase [Sphingomicrobium sediminis]|uniref:Guanylate kinase n=1 Tax=Sphingomicrobium sediminis TaxID=2950949 RepID=A0A9X2EJ88_9SPHN|nr:guanylate kinase [Sphingomicrobium sediminis]MCM8558471.1 guanylate kinase [Sphingomicrobium sediminis]
MELRPDQRRGLLIVLSSPSGAGKTTISRMLMAADPTITMSVSATTREPRPGEEEGVHYYFVSDDTFTQMVEEGEFAEWAYVFDHRYGSPKEPIKQALKDGRDILFDIDWQGTQQLETAFGNDLVSIFILPPSMRELERRLRDRKTDSEEVIEGRMRRASGEIVHWNEYDYVLVNDDVNECLAKVHAIIAAERLRKHRRPYVADLARKLVERPND